MLVPKGHPRPHGRTVPRRHIPASAGADRPTRRPAIPPSGAADRDAPPRALHRIRPVSLLRIGGRGLGRHAEAELHALRLIAPGVFVRLPTPESSSGTWGKMIPFMLDRGSELLTQAARRENGLARSIKDSGTFRPRHPVASGRIPDRDPRLLRAAITGLEDTASTAMTDSASDAIPMAGTSSLRAAAL